VSDQRSTGDLERVEVFPCRELLPTDDVRERASALIAREPWGREQWERLVEGQLFDGMESWLPWLTDDHRTIVDLLPPESLVLVVDIGGGTSDFTVVRLGPQRMARADRSSDVLATTGVHIGGTDFDRRLSLDLLMPLLGFRHIGPSGREVPSRVFFDLSTWHLIQWLYSPRALRDAQNLRTDYADAALHARLMRVLNERLGHRLANTVEQAKIAASLADAEAPMPLDWVEAGLSAAVTPPGLAQSLAQPLDQVVACARDCLQRAGLDDGGVDAIYLTGGSSALRPLRQALRRAFPATPQVEGDLFGGVAAGLAVSR